MKKWILGVVMVSVAFASDPKPVFAQKYVPRAKKRKARKLQRKAVYSYRRHKYAKAVKYFIEAYQVWPRRELHFNISMCYGRLGDKIKAVAYLRRFVKDASARELRSIPKWLRDIREEVAVVSIQGPPGAAVTMDGKAVGTVPLELIILPGMHLFVVTKADGKRIAKRDWDVKPGLRRVWEVVETKPRPRLRPRPDPRPRPRPIIIVPPPKKNKPIPMVVTITTGALAVALVGAAIGTGLKAQSLHDDYKANPTRQTRDDGVLMRNMTNGLWGAAGAVAVAAGVMAIFTQWKKKRERSAWVPSVGVGVQPGGASVSVTGRF